MLELLIGLVASVLVGRAIFRGYQATGVLLGFGSLLLVICAIMGKQPLPASVATTGNAVTDVFEYIKYLLTNRGGGLGMMIMVLCGFAAYMTKIGANDTVVKVASKPLQFIKSPYILMVAAYFVACLMSLAVSSAAGLGVLLMATLFPLMVNLGISRGAAAAVCASPAAIILSPTSGDVVVAAEAAGMPLIDFAFKTTLPISFIAILGMAVSHFFWQRYLDNKQGVAQEREQLEVKSIDVDAPGWFAILPFTPIAGVLLFSGNLLPQLDIITILVICMSLSVIIELLRHRNVTRVLDDMQAMYKGMGDAFVGVVMLLVGAGVFAQGLIAIGFIDNLLGLAETAGAGGVFLMALLVAITCLAAITTGSGNAPFYAFVELIPSLAAKMGLNPAFLIIPMLQASNLGRTMSPVSGVVVACSGMANLSPFDVVKRTAVPVLVGLAIVSLATLFMVPATL